MSGVVKEVSAEYRIGEVIDACPIGYKKTEVGIIPKEWEVKSLSDFIASLEAGVSVNSVDELAMTAHGKGVLKTSCIFGGSFYSEEAKQIVDKDLKRAKLNPRKDAIIISRMNTPALVGEVGYVDKDYLYLFLPDRLWQTKYKNDDAINGKWLSYILSFPRIANKIKEAATGTSNSMKNISKGSFMSIKVPSPNKVEQTAIANALSDVDALITSLETLITKKRAIKTAAMQQLLTGKKRLPPFDKIHTGYKQTELGEIPEDWEVVSYGQAFQFLLTATNSRSDLGEDGDTLYVHYGDVHMRWDSVVDFSKDYVPTIARHKVGKSSLLKDGDLVMADASEDYEGIGKSVEVFGLNGLCAVAGLHTFLLRDTGMFVDGYRGYLHLIESTKKQFDRLATGLKVYGLSKGNLKDVLLPVPPKEEQKKIVDSLSAMSKEIDLLFERLTKTQHLKQGMMQELLTGRTRLI